MRTRGVNARPLMVVTLISWVAAAQTVYTWTDEDGLVHYTDDAAAVPKPALPSQRPVKGAVVAIAKQQPEAPIPYVTPDHWHDEVPACRDALTHFRARRAALEAAEAKLNELRRQFAPCQHFADVCYASKLTLETWRKECRERQKSCDLVSAVRAQEYAVEVLRDEFDQLPEWLEKVAAACRRGPAL